MPHQILKLPAVTALTGLSKSSIYVLIAQGDFPKSIPLSERAVGWLAAEIDDWIATRIELSRKSA